MNINILTMFPDLFDGFCKNPVVGRALKKGLLTFNCVDIKEHTDGCFRKLDDSPCGGGKGMILRCDAVCNALDTVLTSTSHVVLLSPKGKIFNQAKARELSSYSDLVFICGRFEGYDARIESYVDEYISLGDFILTGGENAACVICDSIVRLLPDVLKSGVADDESFESGLLEYNQYTHPVEFRGQSVPSVLLSGNKAEIEKYKKVSSLMETAKYRPDLLYKCGIQESIGRSTASVLMFDDFVMKVEHSDFENSEREYRALEYLNGKTGVPSVHGFYRGDDCFLLMDRIYGRMLCDSFYLDRTSLLVKTAASALKALWSVDISDCKLDSSPEAKLAIAKYNIENNNVDFDDSLGFDSPTDLYNWLVEHKPDMDPVFSHGDFCLPNVIISKKGKVNYLDLGLAGVGDRYCDIALCLRSLKYNLNGKEFDEDMFFDVLGIDKNPDKIKWYTLLDELF